MTSFTSIDDCFDFPAPRRRGAMHALVLIGGVLAAAALAGQTRVGAWLRGFFSAGDGAMRDRLRARLLDARLTLPQLREALLGRSKAQIASRFGPPSTALMNRPGRGRLGPSAFWHADTWYYPIDPDEKTAMAVTFDRGVAAAADFFEPPLAEAGGSAEAVTQ
ncbi:MAG: hypothetical protein ABIP55_16240 [Tepidisphaeraceae bacterium]